MAMGDRNTRSRAPRRNPEPPRRVPVTLNTNNMAGNKRSVFPDGSDYQPRAAKRTRHANKITAEKKDEAGEKVFPFLELPGELRNSIYEYALVDHQMVVTVGISRNNPAKVSRRFQSKASFDEQHKDMSVEDRLALMGKPKHGQSWKSKLNTQFTVTLLSVCQQIHKEAAPLFYAENHFAFLDDEAMAEFLRVINGNIKFIQRISLYKLVPHSLQPKQNECFTALIRAVKLQDFILEDGLISDFGYTLGARHLPAGGSRAGERFYRCAHGWLWTLATLKGDKDQADSLIRFPWSTLQGAAKEKPIFKLYLERMQPLIRVRARQQQGFERNFRAAIRNNM